jgi:hypothetical protein
LFLNQSTDPIDVDQVGASGDRFVARASGLPRQLAPGETLPVEIEFRSAEPGDIGSLVAIKGPEGCSTFLVSGTAVPASDGLTTLSAYALDFGNVTPGSLSDTQELSVLGQSTESSVSISASGGFEVVGAPRVKHDGDCVTTTAALRFGAGDVKGPVKGAAGIGVSTVFEGEHFEGSMLVALRATVQ